MTAQSPDHIDIGDEQFSLASLPLDPLLRFTGIEIEQDFICSGNWRGYTAKWRLSDGVLWLDDVQGTARSGGRVERSGALQKNAECERTFTSALGMLERASRTQSGLLLKGSALPPETGFCTPNVSQLVSELTQLPSMPTKAWWYSGLLRIPSGKLIDYVHGGFLSDFESDKIFEVIDGHVTRQWVLDTARVVRSDKQSLLWLRRSDEDVSRFREMLQTPQAAIRKKVWDRDPLCRK